MQVLTKAVSSYFNSQPREGGWRVQRVRTACRANFNSQPREGGWFVKCCHSDFKSISTHSRAKAAGCGKLVLMVQSLNFNSQPREGGWEP